MKFEELVKLNVNDKVEKKESGGVTLSYLSWAWAWGYFKKIYPEAKYDIKKFSDDKFVLKPYMYDENTGYMVMTSVTVGDETHEMWLPVMDGANKAMKSVPYTYMTRKGEKTVEPATMFDVNKAIMRCLVKNLAMFGLGLYIYAGEDLPEEEKHELNPEMIRILNEEISSVAELQAFYNMNKIAIDKSLIKEFNTLVSERKRALEAEASNEDL